MAKIPKLTYIVHLLISFNILISFVFIGVMGYAWGAERSPYDILTFKLLSLPYAKLDWCMRK